MKTINEPIKSDFEGTIIDLETVGNFSRQYEDSRQYSTIIPVFFGAITKNGIEIQCAEKKSEVPDLLHYIQDVIHKLPRPFHAFNTPFEMGVIFHSLKEKILFEKELNRAKFEAKRMAVRDLKLFNYDDPFNDNGRMFPYAWEKGKMKECIAHNRADLLKEKDILLKRGFREPDGLEFVNL